MPSNKKGTDFIRFSQECYFIPTFFSLTGCPTGTTTSTTWFKEVEGKCYYIQILGCPDGNGCTFQESQTVCSTIFGSGISGIVFEPATAAINNAVLQTAKDTTGVGYWYWIGVSNVDLTYQSNGSPVSFSPIPWASGYPTSGGIECVSGNSANNEWLSRACDTTYGYTICEISS